jgi:hypothetical protein
VPEDGERGGSDPRPRIAQTGKDEPMSANSDPFGSWHTAPDGTAHYVFGGKCLCGTKLKASAPAPERDAVTHAILSPMCVDCIDLNTARWRGKQSAKTGEPLRPQRSFWWRQPRRGKR